MKTRKKLISLLMVLVLILSSFAFCSNVFATTYLNIGLDIVYSATVNGNEDMAWFSYTPEVSGTYIFLGYNTGKTHAYLYTRTKNENGSMTYNGLAYAPDSDPDWQDEYYTYDYAGKTYYHRSTNFRLTYHLEAGTTYYYTAGWATSTSVSGTMSVRLTCAEYDNTVLDSVYATSNSSLTWYTDGEWKYDSNGLEYFHYNYSKILQNMTVTLVYKDGTTSKATNGADTIDGYSIRYNDNQRETHWYNDECDEYVANIITITVGSVSYDYEVVIDSGPLYTITGYVEDYTTGERLSGASLMFNNSIITQTDSDGKFNFTYSPGSYYFTVTTSNAIPRKVKILVDAYQTSNNDHTSTPIKIVTGDYVSDGIINAKDYAYIQKRLTGDKKQTEIDKFQNQLGFRASDYTDLTL